MIRVLKRATWPDPLNHKCDLPGRRERRRLGLDDGAIIECHCGRQYRFVVTEYGAGWHAYNVESWEAAAERGG